MVQKQRHLLTILAEEASGAPVEEGGNREDGDREEENGEATIVVARPTKRVKAAKAVLTVPRRSGRVLRK